jgi:hypothetical protein
LNSCRTSAPRPPSRRSAARCLTASPHPASGRRALASGRFIACRQKERPPAGGLAVHAPGQNSFGIKLCPARSDRKIIPGMALAIKNVSPEMEYTCALGLVIRCELCCLPVQSAGRRGSGAENPTLPLSAGAAHLLQSWRYKRTAPVGEIGADTFQRALPTWGLGGLRKRCYSAQGFRCRQRSAKSQRCHQFDRQTPHYHSLFQSARL